MDDFGRQGESKGLWASCIRTSDNFPHRAGVSEGFEYELGSSTLLHDEIRNSASRWRQLVGSFSRRRRIMSRQP